MDDKRFEHLIQSKLADYEANVPVNLWESIENELPRKKVVPFRRILWTSAAAIIAGIVGISIFTCSGFGTSTNNKAGSISLFTTR